MLASLRVITPATLPAADLTLLARHARIDSDAETDLLAIYRDAATAIVEKFLNRALMPQTLSWTISQMYRNSPWPFAFAPQTMTPLAYSWEQKMVGSSVIELPYSPVSAISSVTIGSWGASDTTLVAGTDYTSDLIMDPARLRLDPAYSWGTYNHCSVTYVAGYADAAHIPVPVLNAIMLLATNLYENRGDDERGGGMSQAVKSLLNPYRLASYAG